MSALGRAHRRRNAVVPVRVDCHACVKEQPNDSGCSSIGRGHKRVGREGHTLNAMSAHELSGDGDIAVCAPADHGEGTIHAGSPVEKKLHGRRVAGSDRIG